MLTRNAHVTTHACTPGLVSALVAKAFGATSVVITDVAAARLAKARELGVTAAVNVAGLSAEQAAAAVLKAGGGAADVTIDA